MTLPISQNSPVYSAPPTEEMLSKLIYVKWCVLVTYLCAIGLFVADADEPFGPLYDLFVACFGTFLLKEDPALAPCFRCLQETGLGVMSDGGLSCLLPYLLMASLNCAFGLLRVYTFATKYGSLLPCSQRPVCYLPVLVFFSSLSQLVASCLCWKVYKLLQLQAVDYLQVEAVPSAPAGPPVHHRRHSHTGVRGSRRSSRQGHAPGELLPFQGTTSQLSREAPANTV
mmetsp:Transcript_46095/g.73199  ORF Transcript_46095/g.73199 Transcript_46095/m.73199 type:complete len:227 (-) Transcript_46095:118-798(-)